MPIRRNNSAPPKTMTWLKASPVLAVCVLFDLVRMFFEQFWFFGPALLATGCISVAESWVGSLWGATEAVCVAGAGFAGYWGAGPLESFGLTMAMAVGLMGWLAVGIMLLVSNTRIFEENAGHALWFAASLLVSEVPIIGTIPALSVIVWRMYRTQIRKESEKLAQYEREQEAERARARAEQARQAAELIQMREARAAAVGI